MGQARFINYPCFIIFFNRAAMRATLDLHGLYLFIYLVIYLFFNRAAMGQPRFIIYLRFIFHFFIFLEDQTQAPLDQLWITQSVMFLQTLLKL